MTKENRKVGKKRMKWQHVLLIIIALYFIIQGIRCTAGVQKARKNLQDYNVKVSRLSYGDMTYVEQGGGETILSIHGIFGGYDQAYDSVKELSDQYHLLAPSRFGYLGSDVYGKGTPIEQADAFKELLDTLGIDKVFVLGASAGGTPAIRFALDYPERVKGLILFCSAMPVTEKPEKYSKYQAPPEPLLSDYAMYLIEPLMPVTMGLPASTVESILPVKERRTGVILDGKLTNPDMERNFEHYPIETLQVPTLIIHSEDDQVAAFDKVKQAQSRFPNLTLISFPDGGHMMTGHGQEIDEALEEFIDRYK
jgi:pimeloyl-ACP methyl ester carboxylesterase